MNVATKLIYVEQPRGVFQIERILVRIEARVGTHRRRHWTDAERQVLRELWPCAPLHEVMERLGRSKSSIYGEVYSLGLKRPLQFLKKEFGDNLRKVGIKHRFPKGQQPWNKGTKGVCKGSSTSFKKGTIPPNTLYDGAISIRRDSKGIPYRHIRLAQGKWELLHRHIWEQANGPVPEGHVVKFKDGNQENCALENVYLCTRQEHMQHNTIHNYPPELKQTIRTLGKLKKTIRHASEQNN